MDYYTKYLKYKTKYLQLKAELEGGKVEGETKYVNLEDKNLFGPTKRYIDLEISQSGDFTLVVTDANNISENYSINKENVKSEDSESYPSKIFTVTIDETVKGYSKKPIKPIYHGVYQFSGDEQDKKKVKYSNGFISYKYKIISHTKHTKKN